jgi:hypothetical protein
MSSYKFKLGELVDLTRASGIYAAPGPYEIVRLLPAIDGVPHYRIKGRQGDHERVAKETELTRSHT